MTRKSHRGPSRHRATRDRKPANTAPRVDGERAKATAQVEAATAHVEDMLDEALMQTFPASDPVTLKACRPGASTPASAGNDPVPRGTGPNDGHQRDSA